jgi:hypothetical protein
MESGGIRSIAATRSRNERFAARGLAASVLALTLLLFACSDRGHVILLTDVSPAEVWVDGVPAGAIGPEGFELDGGPHLIEVKAEGYVPWSSEIEVSSERPAVIEIDLVGLTAFLIVRSNVSGDTVWIDDTPVGSSGPQAHEIPSGLHVVRVERPGYTPFLQEVKLTPQQTVTIEAALVGIAGSPGYSRGHVVVPVPVPGYAPNPYRAPRLPFVPRPPRGPRIPRPF